MFSIHNKGIGFDWGGFAKWQPVDSGFEVVSTEYLEYQPNYHISALSDHIVIEELCCLPCLISLNFSCSGSYFL